MRGPAGWITLLVLGMGVVPPAEGQGAGPLVAAHRGGAGLWAENSLGAFRGAVALGVDWLELDVHLTRDGGVAVIHDPSLERTTTGTGQVRHLALEDLRRARLKGADGRPTDEGVPTLEEVLDLVAPTGVGVLLEVKTGPGGERYPAIEEAVLAGLRARGLQGRTVVMSFHPGVLQRVRQLAPGIRLGLLISRRTLERQGATVEAGIGWARTLGASDLGLEYPLIDAGVLAAARAQGLRTAAWTINEDPDLRRMIGLGVDILITDRPDRALRLLGR